MLTMFLTCDNGLIWAIFLRNLCVQKTKPVRSLRNLCVTIDQCVKPLSRLIRTSYAQLPRVRRTNLFKMILIICSTFQPRPYMAKTFKVSSTEQTWPRSLVYSKATRKLSSLFKLWPWFNFEPLRLYLICLFFCCFFFRTC